MKNDISLLLKYKAKENLTNDPDEMTAFRMKGAKKREYKELFNMEEVIRRNVKKM